MIYTVAVDPGKNHCGLAVFDTSQKLVYCDVIHTEPRAQIHDLRFRQGSIRSNDCIEPMLVAHEVRRVVTALGLVNVMIDYVSEWPEHYEDAGKHAGGKKSGKGVQAKSLFWLSGCADACAAVLNPISVRKFLPKEWKTNIADEVCWARIERAFDVDEGEHAIVESLKRRHGKNAHHALEAAGIGLYALMRLGAGMSR